jgi:hypothetical protein
MVENVRKAMELLSANCTGTVVPNARDTLFDSVKSAGKLRDPAAGGLASGATLMNCELPWMTLGA